MIKLNNEIAVVTGAGSGIGRAIAIRLAKEGSKVVVNDLSPSNAEETVKSKVGVSTSMGYISSVEITRETLEKLYKKS